MNYIDNFLNSITMYRLVLYGLTLLAVLGIAFGFVGVLPLSGLSMLVSLVVLIAVCQLSNSFFGWVFKLPVNIESSYITAFILFLILQPPANVTQGLMIAVAAIAAMASKYVLSLCGRHVFNPAALAAVLVGLSGITAAVWWIGSGAMAIPVIIVGLLVVRKIRRFSLFFAFLITAILSIIVFNASSAESFQSLLGDVFTSWPILFFGTIMLTEPLTTPPHRWLQVIYGVIAGFLIGIPFNIGALYNTPELTLLISNIFSYIVSPKRKLILRLKEKIQMAPLVYDFVFVPNHQLAFAAGQYMEWTLGHEKPDARGNRRYFTVASSPTENEIHLGVKIPPESSTFKRALQNMKAGDELLAGQLSGDFILPKDKEAKIVGIAGGIGVTPFRSMVKNIIDTKQKRDMVLFYASADPAEFVYRDVLNSAALLGVKVVPVLSGAKTVPANWTGKTGYITKEMIEAEVSDYKNRLYYLSGPNVMVNAYKKLLASMGVLHTQIITDYFPGY